MLQNKSDCKLNISDYIALFLISFNLLGIRTPYNNYVFMIMTFVWIASAFIEKKFTLNTLNNKILLSFVIFIFYSFITGLISKQFGDAIKINISLLYTYFSILLFYTLIYNKNYFIIKTIFLLSVFLMIFTSIFGIIIFNFNLDISSLIISHRIKYHLYPFGHLLGSYFSIALLCVFVAAYVFSIKNITVVSKTISILFIAFALFTIYKVRSSITLIVCIFGILICILFGLAKRYNNYRKAIFLLLSLLILVLLLFVVFSPELLGTMLENLFSSDNSKIGSRILSIAEILKGNSASSAFNSPDNRFNQIYYDVQAFIKSPILGYNYITAGNEDLLAQNGLGLHSQIFDYLAQFGIIGFIAYILIFIFHIDAIHKTSKKNITLSWIVTLVLLMIVNPFRDFSSIHTLFFIIPSAYILLGEINIEDFYNYTRISK